MSNSSNMEQGSPRKRDATKDTNGNSPYKKFKNANKEWIPFTSMSKLTPNKPYKMLGLIETNHESYGKGQQATIVSSKGQKCRTQLPGKYLREINPDDVKQIKEDVMNSKEIYLVFREKLVDNSFRIDLTEASATWIECFKKDQDVPELLDDSDTSIHSEDESDATKDGNGKDILTDNENLNEK